MSSTHEISELESMFVARTAFRSLVLAEPASDRRTGSRIGGPPPACVAAAHPSCPVCGGGLEYMVTLAGDTLRPAIARGRAVSLLCCRNFDCFAASCEIIHPSPVVLLAHEDCPSAEEGTLLDSPFGGLALELGPIEREPQDGQWITMIDCMKIGGIPGYIQRRGPQEGEKALAGGRGFLFQHANPVYPDGVKTGSDHLGGGVVYVFSRLDPATRLPMLEDFAAFWQFS